MARATEMIITVVSCCLTRSKKTLKQIMPIRMIRAMAMSREATRGSLSMLVATKMK